jgi:hypothetical protein
VAPFAINVERIAPKVSRWLDLKTFYATKNLKIPWFKIFEIFGDLICEAKRHEFDSKQT